MDGGISSRDIALEITDTGRPRFFVFFKVMKGGDGKEKNQDRGL
jgi:hypothetical protein